MKHAFPIYYNLAIFWYVYVLQYLDISTIRFDYFPSAIRRPGSSIVGQLTESESPRLLFIMVVIMNYLFVHDDKLTSERFTTRTEN